MKRKRKPAAANRARDAAQLTLKLRFASLIAMAEHCRFLSDREGD